jgi:hypothetical protein
MDPADTLHREVTPREFARQAPSFERAGSIFRAHDILEWIGAQVAVTPATRATPAPGAAEREHVHAALLAEADGGAATGLRTRREDAGLVIERRWLIVGGVRP